MSILITRYLPNFLEKMPSEKLGEIIDDDIVDILITTGRIGRLLDLRLYNLPKVNYKKLILRLLQEKDKNDGNEPLSETINRTLSYADSLPKDYDEEVAFAFIQAGYGYNVLVQLKKFNISDYTSVIEECVKQQGWTREECEQIVNRTN
ncbi:MAG: hypothetical protein COU28_00730 [Candidatus Magasanikbacteria bacterium CG10_big_fil_rev_8_21_14_0_10_36_16]|uniref:Uncharacterized protein n=1 Tax=Candidatus Magasanikbacteria bacterium CG10_big_fil_rev_8_21_14_0_10_36_16 TaxID=1974645 RepID=A0A2H0TZE9_9BACT|nr:MAG: hypothetical protein COU28_00730 [Candidatus Magasanikbacteria bacterium CG10_big_fil_rev_8_21_14_0_10_36_16]